MSWVGSIIARIKGTKVLFWGHGWLRREKFPQRTIRNIYYRLSSKVLVYAERGKELGVDAGFPARDIVTIYNSLDTDEAERVLGLIEAGELDELHPARLFDHQDRPIVICTARLTKVCRFDLLLKAAKILKDQGRPINVLLVGDGTEREALEALARSLEVDVHFHGAVYDETRLAQLIYRSDVTVSPGKIGLTAMHSMMYGTPAITHGEFDNQMPEFEAIVPGETGAFFRRNDEEDLARTIADWLDNGADREQVRAACRECIATKWNPQRQVELIEGALDAVFGDGPELVSGTPGH